MLLIRASEAKRKKKIALFPRFLVRAQLANVFFSPIFCFEKQKAGMKCLGMSLRGEGEGSRRNIPCYASRLLYGRAGEALPTPNGRAVMCQARGSLPLLKGVTNRGNGNI